MSNYLGQLNNIPDNPQPGDWYQDNEGHNWICNISGTKWLEFTPDANGNFNIGLTNYELNKMVVNQLPSKITNGQLKEYKEILKDFADKENNKYYMLLCNDTHYYTVIKRTNNDKQSTFYNTVIELLQDNGEIKLIDYDTVSQAIECWITNEEGTYMFLLFSYDWGIVECE